MNTKHLLLFAMTLLCSTNTYSMDPTSLYELRRTGKENITHANDQDTFLSLPQDIWLYTIARYHIKDDIRKTCRYFRTLASSTNTALLTHPSLTLTKKALEQFMLYHAAMGDTAIVRNLLAIGADPNTCDDNQMTVMHYAAEYGHVDIVDMLLQHPALITTDISNGDTSPFMLAIQRDHNLVVKNIFSTCNPHGADTLYYAVKQGALNSVRTLLAYNVDPNALRSNGDCNPLIESTSNGDTHIMKLLIAKGAQVNYRSKNKDNINATPLHFAVRGEHTGATQLLIDYGADVNLKGTNKNVTPLHLVSNKGHINVVKILLNHDADINATDKDGETPLDYAKDDEIKQLLIARGGKTGAELNNEPEKNNCVMQ